MFWTENKRKLSGKETELSLPVLHVKRKYQIEFEITGILHVLCRIDLEV